MAEGFVKELKGEFIEAYSAGTAPKGIDPRAVEVMKEKNIDISKGDSTNVNDLMDINFDYVVTVCGHAHETCPIFPGKAKVVHVGFDDPPQLALDAKTEEEGLHHYRRVRDEIETYIDTLPDSLIKA